LNGVLLLPPRALFLGQGFVVNLSGVVGRHDLLDKFMEFKNAISVVIVVFKRALKVRLRHIKAKFDKRLLEYVKCDTILWATEQKVSLSKKVLAVLAAFLDLSLNCPADLSVRPFLGCQGLAGLGFLHGPH